MALRIRPSRLRAEDAPAAPLDDALAGDPRRPGSESSLRIVIDDMGHVVDVASVGAHDGALGLQIQRRVSLAYQLERISPSLARGLAQALRDRRPLTSTNLGRGLDGQLYLLRSRLMLRPKAGESELLIAVSLPRDVEQVAEYLQAQELAQMWLPEILSSLDQDGDLRDSLKSLLPQLVKATGVEAGAVFLLSGDTSAQIAAAFGATRQRGYPYRDLDLGHPLLRALLARPRLVQLNDQAPLPDPLLAVACRNPGLLVLAPSMAGRRVVALVALSSVDPDPLPLAAVDLLQVVCRSLGLLVENRQLSAESQHSEPVLRTAYAVSRAISQSLDLDRTFQDIAVNAARVVAGAQCLLLEAEPDGGDLVSVACSEPYAEELMGLRFTFAEDDSVLTDLRRHTSIAVEDVEWGSRLRRDGLEHLDMRSALLIPMFAKNELAGALLLYSPGRCSRYSQTEVGHAEEVAEQAAIAIHNARLYRDLASSQRRVESLLGQLTRTRDHERQRFARVVHDDIVQSIVGAVYRLDAQRQLVSPQSLDEYDETVDVLRHSIEDARRVIWELRPPVLDGLGLEEAMAVLADRADAEGPARVLFSVEELPSLSAGVTTALYKIGREALLNAQRHAEAGVVRVALWAEPDRDPPCVCLKVEDDGVGLPSCPERDADHFGLAMMEEQAALLGGSVSLTSAIAQGTSVDVIIPLGVQSG